MELPSTTTETRSRLDGPEAAGLASLRARLLTHAFLFDDPSVYQAGVEDALSEVEELLRSR